MTRGQLRAHMRSRLDDLAGKLLWPDPELNALIDAAHIEAAARSLILTDTLTLSLTVGRSAYTLPDVLRIDAVRVGNKPLTERSVFDLDRERPNWRNRAPNAPEIYIPVEDQLTIWPAPAAATTATVDVRKLPQPLEDDDDEPALPARYHLPMLDWAFHLAYDKRDADGSDPRRAELYSDRFAEAFGIRMTAQQQKARSDGRKHAIKPNW